MSTYAIIPARGGSKGIPQKNIRSFAGRPLLAWAITAVQQAPSINRLFVSTDDPQIAEIARQWGAEIIHRPPELATDTASSESALLHALQEWQAQEIPWPEQLLFVQCTSPLLVADEIEGLVHLVAEEGYDTAVTMIPFHHFLWQETPTGSHQGINHDERTRLRRQERAPEFLEIGAAYVMKTAGFWHAQHRFFGRIGRLIIPSYKATELDSPEDWLIAEQFLRQFQPERMQAEWHGRAQAIKVIVTDFDGVLTDNKVIVDQEGREAVTCHRGDGWGINLLRQAGYTVACLSTETNPVVAARCQKLGIPYWQGQTDKLATLQQFLHNAGYIPAECLYVGNDTNDMPCLSYVGLAVVPADAATAVLSLAHWQTNAAGGQGVLREIAHYLTAHLGT